MSDENENEFSILLTSLRYKRSKQRKWGMDWTQEGVAKRLAVSRATYNYWENGKAVPSRDDLKHIVSDFGLDDKEETALYRANAQVPSEIDNLNLPFPRNPFFTGREAQLEQLKQYLQESGSVALTQPVSISGLGGIGKTQLALEYAYRFYPEVYRTVLWVNAADEKTLQDSYDDLARRLKLPGRYDQELSRRVQAVKLWLKEHTNWLLIMDNADDLELARSFFPECNQGHILLTTCSQIVGEIGARQLEIDSMQPAEGLLFLLRRSNPRVLLDETTLDTVATDMREAATQVVELLGGLPLALDQAGAYIEATGVSFSQYINLYRMQRRELLSKRKALKSKNKGKYNDHPESVFTTFELCFQKACELHPMAADMLYFCSFFSQPDAIAELDVFIGLDLISFDLDTEPFNEVIAALKRYSLIRRGTWNGEFKILSIHRLVQTVVIETLSPESRTQWRERVEEIDLLARTDFGYNLLLMFY